MDALDSLGEDLVLLSVSPDDGRVTTAQQLGFGLMGSDLVRLAAAGRLTITAGRITVTDRSPCQDPELDAALASLAGARREVRAKWWVSHPRHGIAGTYLERLAAAGVLQAERRTRLGIFPVTRWRVVDAARQAAAKERLDAVAFSAGPVTTAQAALAGLAHATGLGTVLYPGRDGRTARARLERIAKGDEVAMPVPDAGRVSGAGSVSGDGDAASQAVAAANQAARAAADAATSAATQAAIDAATSAAVHAAAQAAHSAAHGAHGGGGHGH
jgi:Golgi phosphoprotein 3 GPP34